MVTTARGGDGGGPLAGYRVVDLTMNMSGPLATMVLADQGADVIKVEPPGGEVIRRVGTGRNGTSTYFSNLNRSKRSIVIDLQHDRGRHLLHGLIDGADVFVQSVRPQKIEKLGCAHQAVCAQPAPRRDGRSSSHAAPDASRPPRHRRVPKRPRHRTRPNNGSPRFFPPRGKRGFGRPRRPHSTSISRTRSRDPGAMACSSAGRLPRDRATTRCAQSSRPAGASISRRTRASHLS